MVDVLNDNHKQLSAESEMLLTKNQSKYIPNNLPGDIPKNRLSIPISETKYSLLQNISFPCIVAYVTNGKGTTQSVNS